MECDNVPFKTWTSGKTDIPTSEDFVKMVLELAPKVSREKQKYGYIVLTSSQASYGSSLCINKFLWKQTLKKIKKTEKCGVEDIIQGVQGTSNY